MSIKNKTLIRRQECVIELVREAKDLVGVDDSVVSKLLGDCEHILNGGQDKSITPIIKSKPKYSDLVRQAKGITVKGKYESLMSRVRCLFCKRIEKIYKLEDKWILTCNCGKILFKDGKLTDHAEIVPKSSQ